MAEIVVDASELTRLANDITAAKYALLARLGERGYQLLMDEVPIRTGNLKKGVASPVIDNAKMQATLNVSASRDTSGPQTGTIFNEKNVATKQVTLKSQPAFNYAQAIVTGRKEIIAKGRGIARAGHSVIGPGFAHMLTIPVSTRPTSGSYLLIGGQIYIFRPSARAVAPNPFDQRAANRLQGESVTIADSVLRQFV